MREVRWFLTALLLIFITLKLVGSIDWSWWWVLSPFWAPLAVATVGFAMSGIGWLLMSPEQRAARKAVKALEAMQHALRRVNY